MSNYHSKDRKEILPYIKLSSVFPPVRVLDIGCGSGSFGLLLKESFNCHVTGIEICHEAADQACALLDTVYTERLESLLESNQIEQPFDLIVLNDVIEHMPDPLSFLVALKKVFLQNTTVLGSVPNFIYIDNLLDIIVKKDFRYRDSGILDTTHLRFFTKKSLSRLLSSAGYNLSLLTPLNYNSSPKWQLLNNLSRGALSDFLTYQYIFIANLRR